jgi:hypothetical protein
MNKARRHEVKMLKYKKRMRVYKKPFLLPDGQTKMFAFRSHSCPCSCSACQQPEQAYNRAKEKERSLAEIDTELIDFACAVSMRTIMEFVKNEQNG